MNKALRLAAALVRASVGHGGGAPGMSGLLQHFLKSGVTIIVIANRDPGTAENIAMFAANRLPAN